MRNLPRGLSFALLPALLACVACGGGSKDSLEKRVSSLQEELTALQNQHDRMSDRMQALEIKAQQVQVSRAAAKEAQKEEEDRLARPPLKVVKLGPGAEARAAEGEDPPVATEEKDSGPRPVIKEYGKPPASQKPVAPGWRAVSASLSQDQPGAPHQKGPDR